MRHKSTELMGTIKAFVEEYYKNYRHSPSTTEIANAVGIARGTAYKYLLAMSDNGMIRYDGQQISTEQTEKVQTEFTSADRRRRPHRRRPHQGPEPAQLAGAGPRRTQPMRRKTACISSLVTGNFTHSPTKKPSLYLPRLVIKASKAQSLVSATCIILSVPRFLPSEIVQIR